MERTNKFKRMFIERAAKSRMMNDISTAPEIAKEDLKSIGGDTCQLGAGSFSKCSLMLY